ncbi:hypothetical protein ACG04R_02185 [Roseateles sp. BYS78W]|uniref:Lipoprotein transmembrane n=1 Tax=Pelomonas candidula TaxID=3299025 RepID=A0ABW7H6T1_9BURK
MVNRISRSLASVLLCTAATSASAACPDTDKVSVFASASFDGFHLYHLLGPRTYRLTIPGKSFRTDTQQIPGHVLYMVDDKVVQSEHVERRFFASFVRGDGEVATLDAQARYEQNFIGSQLPDAKITELGTRNRTSGGDSKPKLFRLWKYEVPGVAGARTYFLSTLLDADTVIMVTLWEPETEDQALEELRLIAGSLQPVPAEHCDKVKWP